MRKNNPNLFINTRHLTDRKEDHLTEFFAGLLLSSPFFRKAYERFVLGRHFHEQGWKDVQIVNVETQCHYVDEKRIPDMILHLSNGMKIACEHKIEALETGKDDDNNPNQLWDYLHLPDVSGLVYVRSNWKPPLSDVVKHPKYVKPLKAPHFLWRDFYHLLRKDDTVMGRWLKEAFEHLGYTPPVALIGEMSGPNKTENDRNRHNFVKLMTATRNFANELGWKYEAGSIEGHYLSKNAKASCSDVLITACQTERFLFRASPTDGGIQGIVARLDAARRDLVEKFDIPTDISINTVNRAKGKVQVIDITTTLRDILGKKARTVQGIEQRLFDFHKPLLLALQEG